MTPHPVTAQTRPEQLPRVVWMLVLGRAVNRLGAFTLPFLAVALTEHFDTSISLAGALLMLFGVATIASRLVGGWLADRLGRRTTIVTGLTLTALAQLGVAGAPNLWCVAIAVAVLGLAFEIYEPPSQALIADVVPARSQAAAYGLLSAALAVAGVIAGLLAAAVGSIDVRYLFVVDAVTCLACALLLWLALPAHTSAPRATEADGASLLPEANPWRDRTLLALLAAGVVFAAIYLQLTATLGLTLVERDIPGAGLGILLTISSAVVALGQPLLRRGRVARLDPWRAMALGYAILAVGLQANAFATTLPHFAAATVLWSIGDLILLGRAYALVAEIAPQHARARYFSVYGLSWGAAAVFGPIAGTALLARGGPVTLWTACALASALLAWWCRWRADALAADGSSAVSARSARVWP